MNVLRRRLGPNQALEQNLRPDGGTKLEPFACKRCESGKCGERKGSNRKPLAFGIWFTEPKGAGSSPASCDRISISGSVPSASYPPCRFTAGWSRPLVFDRVSAE